MMPVTLGQEYPAKIWDFHVITIRHLHTLSLTDILTTLMLFIGKLHYRHSPGSRTNPVATEDQAKMGAAGERLIPGSSLACPRTNFDNAQKGHFAMQIQFLRANDSILLVSLGFKIFDYKPYIAIQ
jgi:hypothetical protein